MKKIFLLIFINTIYQVLFSQVYIAQDAEKHAEGADIIRLKDHSKVPAYIKLKDDYRLNVNSALAYTKQFIRAKNSDFIVKNIQENGNNSQTYRYIQTLDGYPIEFSMWNIQVKDGRVTAMNGDILANPNVSTEFTVSQERALEIALEYIGAEIYMWENEKED